DVNWWVQEINLVIANIRAKYPNERQIILQPVVGGPGESLCTFQGTTVRASYNNPYIDQAIARVVGAEVVSGIDPEASSCGDYADWLGHLTEQAKGPMGVMIGQYYANFGSGGPTPTPPARTATPVPTANPNGQTTVTFDDLT